MVNTGDQVDPIYVWVTTAQVSEQMAEWAQAQNNLLILDRDSLPAWAPILASRGSSTPGLQAASRLPDALSPTPTSEVGERTEAPPVSSANLTLRSLT